MTNPVQVTQGEVEQVARALCELDIRQKRRFDTPIADLERILPGAIDYSWADYVAPAQAAIAALTPARTVGEDEVERIRDALKTAYNEGATAVHYAWIDGNGQRDPDFGEAASDYAASIDIAALTPARTDEVENLRSSIAILNKQCEDLARELSEARTARTYEQGIEDAAQVAYAAFLDDQRKEQQYRDSASAADSTGGREVDLDYAVSYARRASRSRAIAEAILALGTKP